MKIKDKFCEQIALLWKFLGFFQNTRLRALHMMTVVLVVLQFISATIRSVFSTDSLCTLSHAWHIVGGIVLLPLAWYFFCYSIQTRGIKHFFAYLWGDTEQLRSDIVKIKAKKLIGPRPGGLPAIIQGLGFGALLMSVTFGALWYVIWCISGIQDNIILHTHILFACLLGIYILGHGGMALLHFFHWQRTMNKRSQNKIVTP